MIVISETNNKKPKFGGRIFLKTTKMEPEKLEVVKRISSKLKKYIHNENFDLLFYYKIKKGHDGLHVSAQKGYKQNFFTKCIDVCMPDLEDLTDEDYIEMTKGAISRYKEFFPKELVERKSLFSQVKSKARNILKKKTS